MSAFGYKQLSMCPVCKAVRTSKKHTAACNKQLQKQFKSENKDLKNENVAI